MAIHLMKTSSVMPYRNTPSHKNNLSPAQKLYGRPVQDTILAHRRSFASDWQKQMDEVDIHETQALQKAQQYYNQHTRHLPDIRIGYNVVLQHPQTKMWGIYGTVINVGPHRHCLIETQLVLWSLLLLDKGMLWFYGIERSGYGLEYDHSDLINKITQSLMKKPSS